MSDSLLLFRVGERVLALPAAAARQVRPLDILSPLPGSGGALLGLSAAAGRVVPVADLRALLDWPADTSDQHKDRRAPLLLLLDIQDQTLGLPVDDVIGFTEDPQTPGDELLSSETLLGSFQDGHRGHLLHPELLLSALTRRLSPA